MSYPVDPTHDQDIDGVLWGWRWSPNQSNGHTHLTYNFPTSPAAYGGYTSIDGFEAFNSGQIAAASKILAMYDAVCNVDFAFTTDAASANIRMAEANAVDVGSGSRSIPTALGCAPDPNFAPLFAQGDTWFNHDDYNVPTLGGFAFASGLMHEIGHALGLKHGHATQEVQDASGGDLYTNPALPPDHDSLEYSVMTYRAFPGASIDIVLATDLPSTPMQDDILTLQYLYGPNYANQSGNTVYTFNPSTGAMSIDGASQGSTLDHEIFLTIWDGGGNDTYDFSNYWTNAIIDLNPGAWSTPSQAQRADLDFEHPGQHLARGCIANALLLGGDPHGYIENAVGGAGNDWIFGNSVSNVLCGGAGNDSLFGGNGNDTLVSGIGADVMDGGAGNDTYLVDNSRDSAIEMAGQGIDRVLSSVSFTLPANIENLALTGSGNLNGTGNALGNIIVGNGGSNILNGGFGNDALSGGAGHDTFLFDTAPGTTNLDTIIGFSHTDDTVALENAIFASLKKTGVLKTGFFHVGRHADDANDFILYNRATGTLAYDSDGSKHAHSPVAFATLESHLKLTHGDFLVI
jgi:serralysin